MLHRTEALEAASGAILPHLDALAGDDAAVKRAQAGLAAALLAEGLPATEVVALVSGINADLHRRILVRALAAEAEPPPVSFTLLLLGSLGRGESLLRPDQDNGFILDDYDDAEHDRVDAWFRRVAERFCLGLAEVGFTLCKGGVMAMNPLWRKTRSQWRHQLSLWARKRSGAALLFADIFLDLRAAIPNRPRPCGRRRSGCWPRNRPGRQCWPRRTNASASGSPSGAASPMTSRGRASAPTSSCTG
jgi:hypothetical protein